MAQTWTLAEIRAKVRKVTGRPATSQISDVDIDDYIDNYYTNILPLRSHSVHFNSFDGAGLTGSTVAGTGEYALGSDVFSVGKPLLIAGDEIPLSFDLQKFLAKFPESDTTQSRPIEGCLYERKLYLRPLPDAVYTYQMPKLDRPTSLSADGDTVISPAFGPACAYGASVDIFMDAGETEQAKEKAVMLTAYIKLIFNENISSEIGRASLPSF